MVGVMNPVMIDPYAWYCERCRPDPSRDRPAGACRPHDRIQRDAALERVGSITRAIAVASMAAAAAIGVYVSRAVPGHIIDPPTTRATPHRAGPRLDRRRTG